MLQMRNGGCKREIQNWCEFHKSVSGSAMINDSVRIEGTYRLAFRCFITSTCKSHQAQSVKPTASSFSQHKARSGEEGNWVSAWGVMHKRATFAREWSHEADWLFMAFAAWPPSHYKQCSHSGRNYAMPYSTSPPPAPCLTLWLPALLL